MDGVGDQGSIHVGGSGANGDPKLIYFGDGDYVHIGENGADDQMELKAGSFIFTSSRFGGANVGIGTETPLATLDVNGEARVSVNTSGLTFGVPRLIEFISGYVVLMPGDIISTGCPKAAGAIHPGDEMSLEVEKIGCLRNPVTAGTELCPS